MARCCFIVNPTAGHGRALQAWRRIEPLARSLGELEVRFTRAPREGEELARTAARQGFDRVVVVGGDGTVNEVGNGLVGTGAAMAVVPTGTSNDWIRTAGVPRDLEAATRLAFAGRVAKSDAGLAEGYRHFFNIAGIGFDAEVSRRVNDYSRYVKVVGGTVPWLLGIVATLGAFAGAPVRVDVDGEPLKVDRLLLMAIGICRFYGGGMMMLPEAKMDDGLFEIAWGQDLNRAELISLVGKIYKGGHVGHPKVHFRKARRVTASSDVPLSFHLDGDVAGNLPVTMALVPGALNVVLPG